MNVGPCAGIKHIILCLSSACAVNECFVLSKINRQQTLKTTIFHELVFRANAKWMALVIVQSVTGALFCLADVLTANDRQLVLFS